MTIQLMNSREPGATPAALIIDVIEFGERRLAAAEKSQFYKDRRIHSAIADTIRDCNRVLGAAGNFKNGCLYREAGLAEKWQPGSGESVVCDHAVPVTELVARHQAGESIARLIFSPVVRISKSANDLLTKRGLAKTGFRDGCPLYRYSHVGLELVTHEGAPVDPAVWADEDHWQLVRSAEELAPVLKRLGQDVMLGA